MSNSTDDINHVDTGLVLMQTAHDSSYLVRNLLNNLPPVTERVRQMRQGKAPTRCSENELKGAQSQVDTWSSYLPGLESSTYCFGFPQ